MRNIIILLLFLIITMTVNAQNRIDPPHLFRSDTVSVVDKRTNQFILGWNWSGPGRKLDNLLNINSYHAMPPKLDSGIVRGYSSDIADSIKVIEFLSIPNSNSGQWKTITGRTDTLLFNGMSLILNPSLIIDESDNFNCRWNDSSGGVYGFKYHNWSVGDTSSSGIDQHRFRLLRSRLLTDSVVVLDSIWDGTILKYQNYDQTNYIYKDTLGNIYRDSVNFTKDINQFHPYNGKQYYLSINLRALDTNQLNSHLNDVILSIELPYNMLTYDSVGNFQGSTKGLVKFDSLPAQSMSENRNIIGSFGHDFRGIYRKLTPSPSLPTRLNITGEMLKIARVGAATDSNCISLAAFARFVNDKNPLTNIYRNNPPFKNDFWKNSFKIYDYIDSINLKIKYHGKVDLAISWIRLETPNTRKIMFGAMDSIIKLCVDTSFSFLRKNSRHPLLYRFFGADEFVEHQYGTMRYFNMLLDTLMTSEIYLASNQYDDPGNHPKRLMLATGMKELWTGSTISHAYVWSYPMAPYVRRTNLTWLEGRLPSTLGLQGGYAGNNLEIYGIKPYENLDSMNSEYETILIRSNIGFPFYPPKYKVSLPISGIDTNIFNKSTYSEDYYHPLSTQHTIELNLRNNLFLNQSSIYSPKPWIANLWLTNVFYYKADNDIFYYGYRPRTGEEVRLMTQSPLVLGSKGLITYIKQPAKDVRTGDIETAFQSSNDSTFLNGLPDGYDLIFSNLSGGDYCDLNDDQYYKFKQAFKESNYDWNVLGINKNRMYLGLRSSLLELYKTNKFIKSNESQLMNMKLMAWYGKGFLKLYSQDPKLTTDSIMNQYIDFPNIRTKKLYQPQIDGTYLTPSTNENIDSSFFDITIHKDKRLTNDSNFVVAVLNRRTDPLIHTIDTIQHAFFDDEGGSVYYPNLIDPSMKFYSSAEYDMNCKNGGNIIAPEDVVDQWGGVDTYLKFRDTSYWRDKYFKRNGIRIITIPFDFKLPSSPTARLRLRVKEFDGIDTNIGNWCYRKKIDTVIWNTQNLAVLLLPGESKFFNVSIAKEYNPSYTGELDFSNQHKLIAYPTVQTSNNQFDNNDSTVYYHSVYHKQLPSGRNAVFYRRSLKYNPNLPKEIQWEPQEKLISTNYVIKRDIEPQMLGDSLLVDSCNCKHPSIVVRFDEVRNKPISYIVFNCFDTRIPDTSKVFILEQQIPANDHYPNIMPNQLLYPIGFAYSGGTTESDIDKWGVPVVNASALGNYYTWADSAQGICAGYKEPSEEGYIVNRKYLKADAEEGNVEMTQPSLNAYSRIANGENDCALVWKENKKVENWDRIAYTRLNLDGNGNIYNFIPKQWCDPQPQFVNAIYKPDSTIAYFGGWNGGRCNYPSIHRPTAYYLRPGYPDDSTLYTMSTWDRLYWQSSDWYNTQKLLSIKMIDMNKATDCWNCYYHYRINSINPSLQLENPNLSQGTIRPYNSGMSIGDVICNDSAIVLGFNGSPNYPNDTINSRIYLFKHGFWNLFTNWVKVDSTLNLKGVPSAWLIHRGNGVVPQLAKLPIADSTIDWNSGGLLYQASGNNIFTTKEYFYKGLKDEYETHPLIGIVDPFTKNETFISFTKIINDNGIESYPIFSFMKIKNNKQVMLDTICSEWFSIDEIKTLDFIVHGTQSKTAKIILERQKDNKKIEIPSVISKSNKFIKNKIKLLNGNNEKFRIKIIKNNLQFITTQELLIGTEQDFNSVNDSVNTDKLGKSLLDLNSQIIDLNDETYEGRISDGLKIKVYPNPANNTIYLGAYLPIELVQSGNIATHDIAYQITDILGNEVNRFTIKAGELKQIDTQFLPVGTYYINAILKDDYTITTGVERLQIIR